MSPEERFWSRVNKTKSCWLWTGTIRGKSGYGCLEINSKLTSAHRYSWTLSKGNIPDDLFVLHKCDNKLCVRPEHLFLGTQADNNKDRATKNRSWHPTGELHPIHVLTESQVREIRAIYAKGTMSQRDIARLYDVAQWTVGKILNHKTWSHI